MCNVYTQDRQQQLQKTIHGAGARVHFYYSDGFPFANYFEIQLAARYDVFDFALCNKNLELCIIATFPTTTQMETNNVIFSCFSRLFHTFQSPHRDVYPIFTHFSGECSQSIFSKILCNLNKNLPNSVFQRENMKNSYEEAKFCFYRN